MEFYTLEDAEYLKSYYEPIIIGRPLEINSKSIIEEIEIKQDKEGLCRVIVYGTKEPRMIPRRDIDVVALNLHLASPKSVLKDRGPLQL